MNKPHKGGRHPKADPAIFRYSISFNAVEHARFLTLFEQSGMRTKAHFIKARVFDESFRVIKVDRTLLDYYQKLTSFYAQFRRIGVNYNQIVVALKSNFSEQKALAMLFKLESETIRLVAISKAIVALTEKMSEQWSQK